MLEEAHRIAGLLHKEACRMDLAAAAVDSPAESPSVAVDVLRTSADLQCEHHTWAPHIRARKPVGSKAPIAGRDSVAHSPKLVTDPHSCSSPEQNQEQAQCRMSESHKVGNPAGSSRSHHFVKGGHPAPSGPKMCSFRSEEVVASSCYHRTEGTAVHFEADTYLFAGSRSPLLLAAAGAVPNGKQRCSAHADGSFAGHVHPIAMTALTGSDLNTTHN